MVQLKYIGEITGKMILLALFLFIVIAVLFIPVVIAAIVVYGEIDLSDLLETPLIAHSELFIQMLSFIGAVVIMVAIFERGKGLALGWRQSHPLKASIEGSVWGIVLITLSFLTIWLLGGFQVAEVQFNAQVIKGLMYALLLFALVAINEELISRGYIQGLIGRRFGATVAIAITSILFAGMHLLNHSILDGPLPLINLFLVGVFLGILREASGGLWLPIGVHFTWNLFQGNVYGFEVSGLIMNDPILQIKRQGSDLISGGQFGAEGSVVVTLMMIAAVIYVLQKHKKNGVKL